MKRAKAAEPERIEPPVYVRQPSGNPLELARTEWLLADGQGGYAMGTAAAIPTRRYHGWLVASTRPPGGRVVTLSSCVETLVESPGTSQEQRRDLSSFFFPGGVVHPAGHLALTRFETGVTARWDYAVAGGPKPVRVVREIVVLRPEQRGKDAAGGGAAIVRYSVMSEGRPASFEIRPLVAVRDFHELLTARSCEDRFMVSTAPGVVGVEVAPQYGILPRVNLACDGTRFVSGSQWWRDFEYPRDQERGQEFREDLFSPGSFVLLVDGREAVKSAELVVWTGTLTERPRVGFEGAVREQRERAAGLISRAVSRAGGTEENGGEGPAVTSAASEPVSALARLAAAADAFVVRRARVDGGFSTSVIAGYPWFADWGRDTMICVPGLMLAVGRFEEALRTLETFATLCRNGLICNWFDDTTGQAEYNTVDASLWFVHAACRYVAQTGDSGVMRGAVGRACLEIIAAYRAGTEHGIRMDEDGLIMAGSATTQLTWMDARRDGVVFTPRFGKAVEVNALWYNALESLAGAIDEIQPNTARELRSLAERAGASFREKFWNPRSGSCYDCLVPENGSGKWWPETETRPNQIFAASLPHSALDKEQRAGVIECVRSRLLTPLGIRSLAPSDPGYAGRFRGNLFERDRAYHNGTVWPYLLGPYAEAVVRLGDFSAASCEEARRTLAPLIAEMDSPQPGRMLGQIAEVYDGDDGKDGPRQSGGCPAQAWSVAEVLRVMVMAGSAGRAPV